MAATTRVSSGAEGIHGGFHGSSSLHDTSQQSKLLKTTPNAQTLGEGGGLDYVLPRRFKRKEILETNANNRNYRPQQDSQSFQRWWEICKATWSSSSWW